MSNEIIFVGAGPIGLWTAIQIKLARPDIEIILKEKKETYSRSHTLLLHPTSLNHCIKDDSGIIDEIIAHLKTTPHIKTNLLEKKLRSLALSLGIKIELQNIKNIKQDIIEQYPQAAMIIGSDGVHSTVRKELFEANNTEKISLAYAAQIKYFVEGDAVQASKIFETYPLLKQSNYISYVNIGKKENKKTPVTIQLLIDKETHDKIKSKTSYANPIKLLSDKLDGELPEQLLHDIKTQLGFRLNNGENIIINDIHLTATELPQQRCKKVIQLKEGHYHALIGDAALALSYFKGMNSGLQLSTTFSNAIVQRWEKILQKDEQALSVYEKEYTAFAHKAFKEGHKTNYYIHGLASTIHSVSYLPYQLFCFNLEKIAHFKREFDVYHQACEFYINAHLDATDLNIAPSAINVKKWVEAQMPLGLPLLQKKLMNKAYANQRNTPLYKALIDLANIDVTQLNFLDKAYLGLALSKTCTLLDSPTPEHYAQYIKFKEKLAIEPHDFRHHLSTILQLIAGGISLFIGIALSLNPVLSISTTAIGVLLTSHGFYKLQKNHHEPHHIYNAVDAIEHALNESILNARLIRTLP